MSDLRNHNKRLQSLRQEVTATISCYHNLDDRTKCDAINLAVQLYYINRLLDDVIEESYRMERAQQIVDNMKEGDNEDRIQP